MLGNKYAATVKEATYEFTDASVERQIVELKATGCDALIAASLLKFAVQTPARRATYNITEPPSALSVTTVRANHIPRVVSRADALPWSMLNVSMPSRPRSATVTPKMGLSEVPGMAVGARGSRGADCRVRDQPRR